MHTAISERFRLKKIRSLISCSCFNRFGRGLVATLFLLFIFALFGGCGEAEAELIRVGVASNVSSAALSGTAMTAQDAAGHKFPLSKSFTASAKGSSVMIDGKSYRSPVTIRSSRPITVGRVGYEGEIILRAQGGRLTVINRLDVEKYIRGVLGYEINPAWDIEVLRAQAIISRTFALSQMGRHGASGFDVCTEDHCQVYRGINVHKPSTDRAITQTRGKVLTYNGKLAEAFFHSDSGGATADVKNVWGHPVPYLVVRPEPYPSQSQNAFWQVDISASEIAQALSKKGINVGSLRSVEIIGRDSAGRSTALKFNGTSGSASLTSASFRTAVGAKKLRSTFFEFSPISASLPKVSANAGVSANNRTSYSARSTKPVASGEPLTPDEQAQLNALIAQKKFTVDERLDMMLYPERRRAYLNRYAGESLQADKEANKKASKGARKKAKKEPDKELKSEPIPQPPAVPDERAPSGQGSIGVVNNGVVTFYGRGWGHGVGLSQWGARAMAEHGWSAERILAHYYPGTVIRNK